MWGWPRVASKTLFEAFGSESYATEDQALSIERAYND